MPSRFGNWFRRQVNKANNAVRRLGRGQRPGPVPPAMGPPPPVRRGTPSYLPPATAVPEPRPQWEPSPQEVRQYGPPTPQVREPMGGPTYTRGEPTYTRWDEVPPLYQDEVRLYNDDLQPIQTTYPMSIEDWMHEALRPKEILVREYGIDNIQIMKALDSAGYLTDEDWEDWRNSYDALYG